MSRLPVEKSLGYQVRMTHRAFHRILGERLKGENITAGHWYYLRALWQQDGVTQKQLSDATNVRETTTVSLIAEMVAAGLVTKRRDKDDRRKWIIFLTKKGRDLEKVLMPGAIEINNIAMSNIPEHEIETFFSVLQRMRENLHEHENSLG